MRLGEFCDLGGNLAQFRGDRTLEDRPVRIEYYAVAKGTPAVPLIIGQSPWNGHSNTWSGEVQTAGGGRAYVACDDWPTQEVEVPIPAPRNGRDYGWSWAGYSGWIKDYFPMCGYCGRWHDPMFSHCSRCERAMKPQKHDVCALCRKEEQA